MKRLCIYLTYDKQNIIDEYIGYMLRELRSCAEYVAVVCNMENIIKGKNILNEYADIIIYRKNIGFDAGGFKDALCEYIGWDKVLEYDELVLANDSMFGPFRPMKDIFVEMERKNVDFWGLTKHGTTRKNGVIIFHEHIQSFFLVICSKMLHSIEFRQYWENLPLYTNFFDVVLNYEVKFTPYFSKLGYTYDVLADTKINDTQTKLENNYSQYALISYELIRKRNFPFLKKQQIADNTLSKQTQENLYQALTYIDKKTDYDIKLIWDNIIRTLNIVDLQRNLHLQYIISSDSKKFVNDRKIAIVIFADYEETIEIVLEYLFEFVEDERWTINIISEKEEILELYKKNGIDRRNLFYKEQYRLIDLIQYNYVCILHDSDITSNINSSCTGKSYFYSIWENLLKNVNHVLGIIQKFEEEDRLGFLASPQPIFADYFCNLAIGWDRKYEKIVKIVKELNLNCVISNEKPPLRITNDFWIRGNILKWLSKLNMDDFKYISFLWTYFAQDMGYYSGIVESADYTSMNEVNLYYYLNQISTQIKRQYGKFKDFYQMRKYISYEAVQRFCRTYSPIYVYGVGYVARIYEDVLLNVEAYIVSDGQLKPKELNGIPVKYLSEIEISDTCGFVICLSEKNQIQISTLLEKKGGKNYICVN